MVFELNETLSFPDPKLAEEDGWLAIGGDLSIPRLLLAYNNGIFPWYSEGEPICWYSPHQRCVIFPDDIIVSKSMKKVMAKNVFDIRFNTAFADVIRQCRHTDRPGQDGTWISTEMQEAYIAMHELGYAFSVEAWQNEKLVGGLYGVRVNNVFCGESMFSHVANASKAALVCLCREGGFTLIDCQLPNPHLISLGAVLIDRDTYMKMLKDEERNKNINRQQ